MRNLFGAVADRLVGLVVPATTVGACCPPDPYEVYCFCALHKPYYKTCQSDCACRDSCASICHPRIGSRC